MTTIYQYRTENMPNAVEPSSINIGYSTRNNDGVMEECKHNGLYYRKVTEDHDYNASLQKYCTDEMKFTELQFFELMIPKHYFIIVI